jgi:phytoene dehydrogenase-like protein
MLDLPRMSVEKSDVIGDASRRTEYLGFVIDTSSMMIFVPEYKLAWVIVLLDEFLSVPVHTVR